MKQKLFERLYTILEDRGVRYAVLGDTSRYPEEIGSDIDIMVHPDDLSRLHLYVWEIEDVSTKVVQMFQHEIVAFYYVVAHVSNSGVTIIQPDVCSDYYRKGVKFLSADELLLGADVAVDTRGKSKGFKVLSPANEFIYYLLKKIDKGHLDECQFNHLRMQFSNDPLGCMTQSLRFWNNEQVAQIQSSLESGTVESLRGNLPQLREGLHAGRHIRPRDRVLDIIRQCRRCLQPSGFVVCICGAGPSVDGLVVQLTDDFKSACRRQIVVDVDDKSLFTMLRRKIGTVVPRIKSTLVVYRYLKSSRVQMRVLAPDVVVFVDERSASEKGEGKTLHLSEENKECQNRLVINQFLVAWLATRATRRYRH